MKTVLDKPCPDAEGFVLVMDNLNMNKLASLYEAFEPEEAHRLSGRFEIHCTPKHEGWLNMVEIELSALARQDLKRRVPDDDTLMSENSGLTGCWNFKVVNLKWFPGPHPKRPHITGIPHRIRL